MLGSFCSCLFKYHTVCSETYKVNLTGNTSFGYMSCVHELFHNLSTSAVKTEKYLLVQVLEKS